MLTLWFWLSVPVWSRFFRSTEFLSEFIPPLIRPSQFGSGYRKRWIFYRAVSDARSYFLSLWTLYSVLSENSVQRIYFRPVQPEYVYPVHRRLARWFGFAYDRLGRFTRRLSGRGAFTSASFSVNFTSVTETFRGVEGWVGLNLLPAPVAFGGTFWLWVRFARLIYSAVQLFEDRDRWAK